MATLVVCQAHHAPTKRETLGDEVAVILSSKERFRGLGVNRFRTRLNWDIVTIKQGLSTLKTYNVRFPTLSFPSHWTRKIKTILNSENIPFILRPHHSLLKRVEKLLCPSHFAWYVLTGDYCLVLVLTENTDLASTFCLDMNTYESKIGCESYSSPILKTGACAW